MAVISVAAISISLGSSLKSPLWALILLSGVAFLAERQPVRIGPTLEMTVAVMPVLFAAVAYGPLDAMVVAAMGLLGDAGRPIVRWVIWTSMRCLAGGLGGLAALAILADSRSFGALLVAVAAAALTDALVDIGLGSLVIAIRRSGSARQFVRDMAPLLITGVPLYTPVIVLLAYAYRDLSEWTLLLFFAPAFAAQSIYRLYQQERAKSVELEKVNARLEKANLSFATALVATLDARDKYTAGHSTAVAVYARDIARQLRLDPEQQRLALLCGLVHDIGKIGLPPLLLDKTGPLTPDERRQMERHCEVGQRILAKVEDYSEIAEIVRHHHEHLDGRGYPDRLRGSEIPLISRIISVADAYNAMTSNRPYRSAMESNVAIRRLRGSAGTQFDSLVVAAFETVLASGSPEYRSGVEFSIDIGAELGEDCGLLADALCA